VDWHRCFVFHKLALEAIREETGSPVWLSDSRIAAVASASIDRSTVDLDKGEMAFRIFRFDIQLDTSKNRLFLIANRPLLGWGMWGIEDGGATGIF